MDQSRGPDTSSCHRDYTAPRRGVAAGTLAFTRGVRDVDIYAGQTSDRLFTARFRGRRPKVSVNGKSAVEVHTDSDGHEPKVSSSSTLRLHGRSRSGAERATSMPNSPGWRWRRSASTVVPVISRCAFRNPVPEFRSASGVAPAGSRSSDPPEYPPASISERERLGSSSMKSGSGRLVETSG
jgi:hypothetical protein